MAISLEISQPSVTKISLKSIFLRIYWNLPGANELSMYLSGELFIHSWEGYFGVYFLSCKTTREINTKITLEWVHKQFVTRVVAHTLIHFLHDIMNPYMMIKTMIFTHHLCVSLIRLTFCWWCHNRLLMMSQWPDCCVAITWIMISNSLISILCMTNWWYSWPVV